jgi:hypothetical protein
MSEEIWKVIDNFSNYEISSFGNLRNKTTKYILNPYLIISMAQYYVIWYYLHLYRTDIGQIN